jgi:hypothetical protein
MRRARRSKNGERRARFVPASRGQALPALRALSPRSASGVPGFERLAEKASRAPELVGGPAIEERVDAPPLRQDR